ncbi:hypothetical protein [Stappia sp.]|uniref:hypothetical protein n=1 Tax=Stappia sp. TaxID=1870903 RepID=UPI003C7EAD87
MTGAARPNAPSSPLPFARSRTGAVIAINVNLLVAALFAGLAWAIWPENGYLWWPLYLLSIASAIAGLGTLIVAVKTMIALRARAVELARLEAMGGALKSARLAGLDDQIKAGMR